MSEYQHNKEYETAFYSLRSGEGVKEALETLSATPERPLDEFERQAVLDYEAGLSDGRYIKADGSELRCENPQTLEEVKQGSLYLSTRKEITADYLLTAEGEEAAAGFGFTLGDAASPEAALTAIRRQGLGADTDALRQLSERSEAWSDKLITDRLVQGEVAPELTRGLVFLSIDKLATKLMNYRQYQDFYHQVGADLRDQDDTRELEAKREINRIYLKVIDEELASVYPAALSAWDQLRTSDDNEEAAAALRAAWPSGERLSQLSPEHRRDYIIGLDRIRNGTVLVEGSFSAISSKLRNVFTGDQEKSQLEQLGDEPPRFTTEEAAKLAQVSWDAQQTKSFCSDVLKQFGLLSEEPETTWSVDRHQWAADNKWQVIVRPDMGSSLGVSGIDGTLRIPKSFYRSLTKVTAPVGVIAGAGHEIMHVFQRENLRRNSGGLRLAGSLQGRSSTVLREAGSIFTEQQIQQKLFGVVRPDAPHYLRAVDELEQGSGEQTAIKAFYDSYRADNPQETPESAAKVAISRVKRLARQYGGFNSQPLNYAQQALIVSEAKGLNDQQRERLFAEGAFDLPDMVTLHRYGLLNSQPEAFPLDTYVEIVEKMLRQRYLQQG